MYSGQYKFSIFPKNKENIDNLIKKISINSYYHNKSIYILKLFVILNWKYIYFFNCKTKSIYFNIFNYIRLI